MTSWFNYFSFSLFFLYPTTTGSNAMQWYLLILIMLQQTLPALPKKWEHQSCWFTITLKSIKFKKCHLLFPIFSTLSSVYKQPKKLTTSLCCLNFSQIWLVLLLIRCLIFVMSITLKALKKHFFMKNLEFMNHLAD